MWLPSRFRSLKHLGSDEGGAVLIWVSAMIFVIFAFVGLAIDGARYLNLNSNLQEIADAAALAGAKELDGAADAIERARNAAINVLDNNPKWSDIDVEGVQIVASGPNAPRFFRTIGGPALGDGDDRLATFIEVTTISRSISTTYTAVLTDATTATTRATAMAKVSYSICRPVQSFLCNPYEDDADSPGNSSSWKNSTDVNPGDMFVLTGGTGLAPGNWGFIYPGASTPKAMEKFWSEEAPASCTALDVANASGEVRTGEVGKSAEPGMNVRFGFPSSTGGSAAPIVIDGYKETCNGFKDVRPKGFQQANEAGPSSYKAICSDEKIGGSCPLPRDPDIQPLATAWGALNKGSGPDVDDLKAYWKNQHGSLSLFPTGATTRYELYNAEIAGLEDPALKWNVEPPQPACSTMPVGDPSRRLVNVAIVDCKYWSITGKSNPLPIITLTAQFFMTEPATAKYLDSKINPSEEGSLYAEYVQSFEVNQEGGSVFQIVQLVK